MYKELVHIYNSTDYELDIYKLYVYSGKKLKTYSMEISSVYTVDFPDSVIQRWFWHKVHANSFGHV